MSLLVKLLRDIRGLFAVCGAGITLAWVGHVLRNLRTVLEQRNLQVADAAMGPGPFDITLTRYGAKFKVAGPFVFGGIREMYVRDVYLQKGWLRIKDGDVVVDLGANMGNFTNLALSMGPHVKVVAVEPNAALNRAFERSLSQNQGFLERVKLIRAFVGTPAPGDTISLQPDYSGAPWLNVPDLVAAAGLERIDFLKCDIEGGEFGALTSAGLLPLVGSLAVEIHAFAGNVEGMLDTIRAEGFTLGPVKRDPDGTVTALAKRADG